MIAALLSWRYLHEQAFESFVFLLNENGLNQKFLYSVSIYQKAQSYAM